MAAVVSCGRGTESSRGVCIDAGGWWWVVVVLVGVGWWWWKVAGVTIAAIRERKAPIP